MRRISFLQKKHAEPKLPSSSTSPIFVALITGAAVAAASAMTAYVSNKSSGQMWTQSCIKRLDDQEIKIRDKASVFLSNLADYVTKPMDPNLPLAESHAIAEKVIRSAFEFTAYAPDQLSYETLRVAAGVHDSLKATSQDESDAALKASVSAVQTWPVFYARQMAEFEKGRGKCRP